MWTEFNETWQEARSKSPLTKFVFFWPIRKTRWPPWPLIDWDIFDFSSETWLNGIQQNLRGRKISTSSAKFMFFRLIRKTRWPSMHLIDWDIFDFSTETIALNSTKLNGKQDLKVVYQVCVFRVDRKSKMATMANPSKKVALVRRCTICGPFGPLTYFSSKRHYFSAPGGPLSHL